MAKSLRERTEMEYIPEIGEIVNDTLGLPVKVMRYVTFDPETGQTSYCDEDIAEGVMCLDDHGTPVALRFSEISEREQVS